jgi:hypothetical protein
MRLERCLAAKGVLSCICPDTAHDTAALLGPAAATESLEVGGQSAEIAVVSTALREQWKEARSALQTSRNMMAVLEAEYKESRE